MSLWYHYWAMNARGNVVRSWGAPLKFESRDEQLGIRLGDIRYQTSILQPSGIALYKNRRGASLRLSLPLEGKGTIREYPLLKRRRATHLNPSAPRIVIPSAAEGSLLHCRHMHACALTQTTPWCFLFRLSLAHDLPPCKKDPSTSVGMTNRIRIISHSFSYRCVELCLSEALYPAPSARPFSKGLLVS